MPPLTGNATLVIQKICLEMYHFSLPKKANFLRVELIGVECRQVMATICDLVHDIVQCAHLVHLVHIGAFSA